MTPQSDNDNAVKMRALTRLAIARQAQLGDEDFQVYLEGLHTQPTSLVTVACDRLSVRPRKDFEPPYPTLGTILWECRAILADAQRAKEIAAPEERRRMRLTDGRGGRWTSPHDFIERFKQHFEEQRKLTTK